MGITSMIRVVMMELITTNFDAGSDYDDYVMIIATTQNIVIWSIKETGWRAIKHHETNEAKGMPNAIKLEHHEMHRTVMSLCFKQYKWTRTRTTVHPSNKKVTSSASFVSVISCSRWETSSTSGISGKRHTFLLLFNLMFQCCIEQSWQKRPVKGDSKMSSGKRNH